MDKELQPAVATYLLKNLPLLLRRDFLVEILTSVDRVNAHIGAQGNRIVTMGAKPYIGKLIQDGDTLHAIREFTPDPNGAGNGVYDVVLEDTGIVVPTDAAPLVSPDHQILLHPGVIENYTGKDPILTTVGRLIMNYIVLANPFGEVIPYQNILWKPSTIEGIIKDRIIRGLTTAAQRERYAMNLYFIGHMTELAVPVFTEKSLTTDPAIKQRRTELLEKHKDAIKAGDAVIMSQIEAELIAMDRKHLEGDASMGFYAKAENKSFNVQRKKMYVSAGMTERFGEKGNFDFIENSLEEGWTAESFSKIANEIRAGSFDRANETAKGGEASKFLMRVFQNTRIIEDDCGTTKTMPLTLKPQVARKYLYRHIVLPSGKLLELSEEELPKYIGKKVNLRSPMGCKSNGGYCYTCMGQLFKSLDQESMTMRATAIGSFFLLLSMKSMHGQSFSSMEISDLNRFTF